MKALVTGGGGFLGGALIRALVERGDEVSNLARGDYPHLKALGVTSLRGDIADDPTVRSAVRGCDVVFHVAAKAGAWGPVAEFHRANVVGTQTVLAACRAEGVSRLVHTSTPSVVHAGSGIAGGDESLPYATSFEASYPETKAIAEQLVLQANDTDLATVALRPHLMWGPGDTQLVPRILARARAGQLRLIGGGHNVMDSTYIDNAVSAHLRAAEVLRPGAPASGRAYFITNGDPRPVRELVNGILRAGGEPEVSRSIPFGVAYALGATAERIWRIRRAEGEPLMTRFLARQLATDHWFDISAARRDLGYEPEVSIEEGWRRLGEALRQPA